MAGKAKPKPRERSTAVDALAESPAARDKRWALAYQEELLARQTVEEVPHPEEILLRKWLDSNLVDGKFVPWWHQRIHGAEYWGIVISPAWHVIADSLDVLFPDTSNTFNVASSRPCVEEAKLFAYLKLEHNIGTEAAKSLTLTELAAVLQRDRIDRERTAEHSTAPDNIPDPGGRPSTIKRDLDWLDRYRDGEWTSYCVAAEKLSVDENAFKAALQRARKHRREGI